MAEDDLRGQISDCFRKEKTSYKNLLQISGQFLIENDLVKVWAEARGIKPEKITSSWSDYISLMQAEVLGVLDFVNDSQPIRPRPRGTRGGRKPGLSSKAKKTAAAAAQLYKAGEYTILEIMEALSIKSKATLYRYLRHEKVIE